MIPSIATVLIILRIPSTADWSASFFEPRPIHREAAMAAVSVTRTNSNARFRDGVEVVMRSIYSPSYFVFIVNDLAIGDFG
jgi:hypothetical protein